jgi:hypothetical protein
VKAIRTLKAPLPGLFGEAARRRRTLWVLAAVTLAFGIAQLPELVTMDNRGAGIIAFELAGSSGRAHEIVTQWGSSGRSAAQLSLVLDYGYLVGYGLFLAGACTAVAERFRRLGAAGLALLGILLTWAALVAAGSDALENVNLLVVAGGHTSQPWPRLALGFASLKFALSISASLYALLGWVATAIRGRAPASG